MVKLTSPLNPSILGEKSGKHVNTTFSYITVQKNYLSNDVYQLVCKPLDFTQRIMHHAGQYASISIPGANQSLPFSVANAPDADSTLEFHIKRGSVDSLSDRLITAVNIHQVLQVSLASGRCQLTNNERSILFLAGGTGFAQMKALIEQLYINGVNKKILHLFWGARNSSNFYLENCIDFWKKNVPYFFYTPVIFTGSMGFVHAAALAQYIDLTQVEVYVSGPTEFVKATYAALIGRGLSSKYFYSDFPV